MNQIIAPCGNDCSQCDAYIATKTNDLSIKQKLADNFIKQFNITINPESINCNGCREEGEHIGFCFQCSIRACTIEKSYKTCAECKDFPCSKGSFIWIQGSKSKAVLEKLKSHINITL